MNYTKIAEYIRNKSNPKADQIEAIESNARLLDALYRLTFTADKLEAFQVDELINSLQRKENEIRVLLGRIKNVSDNGFKIIPDTKPKKIQKHTAKVVLQESKEDRSGVVKTAPGGSGAGVSKGQKEPVTGEKSPK